MINDSEKLWEADQNGKKTTLSYVDMMNKMMTAAFNSMLKRMKVGETMFHYETMTNYTRIK